MIAPERIAQALRKRFRAAGDAEDAASQKAYMKSGLSFHGVNSAQVRAAAKEICDAHRDLRHEDLRALVDHLFASEWFDVRLTALMILERKVRLLEPADLPWLIALVRAARCWAHVDLIATQLVASLVQRDARTRGKLGQLGRDDDFWVRRTALLAQVPELRAGAGDFELFEGIAATMVEEKEFFIRKAIGWVLRETSKKRPELAFRFLLANRDRVSGLTLREGGKYLPPPMRSKLGLPPARARRNEA